MLSSVAASFSHLYGMHCDGWLVCGSYFHKKTLMVNAVTLNNTHEFAHATC